ncbi:MAG TPA: SGNH/GDSL hydrolase family protein [Chloroflexia bacterium]|nr:SGNH/GDSL hydrolase family protein [Chloroflexia bacterium]
MAPAPDPLRRTALRAALLLPGLLAGYLVLDLRRVRRKAAAAALERFPVGLDFTLENPGAPRQRTIRYLALGDSTVQGEGASAPATTLPYRLAEQLSTRFRRVELRNIGVGGATTADVLRDQVPQIAGFVPDFVSISIGANDVTKLKRRAEYLANVDRILAAVDAQPGVRAVILTVPALYTSPLLSPLFRALVAVQTARFDAALPAVVGRHRAVLADTYNATRHRFAQDPSLYSRDGYHPSDAGYAYWASAAAPAVARAVGGL